MSFMVCLVFFFTGFVYNLTQPVSEIKTSRQKTKLVSHRFDSGHNSFCSCSVSLLRSQNNWKIYEYRCNRINEQYQSLLNCFSLKSNTFCWVLRLFVHFILPLINSHFLSWGINQRNPNAITVSTTRNILFHVQPIHVPCLEYFIW